MIIVIMMMMDGQIGLREIYRITASVVVEIVRITETEIPILNKVGPMKEPGPLTPRVDEDFKIKFTGE